MVDPVSTVAMRQNIFHYCLGDELLLQKKGDHGRAAALQTPLNVSTLKCCKCENPNYILHLIAHDYQSKWNGSNVIFYPVSSICKWNIWAA